MKQTAVVQPTPPQHPPSYPTQNPPPYPTPYTPQGAAAYGGAPIQANAMAYGMGMVNTSGMKSTVPPEILAGGWNWGAFYFSWIRCMANGMVPMGIGILLGSWIPFVGIIAMITLPLRYKKIISSAARGRGSVTMECCIRDNR